MDQLGVMKSMEARRKPRFRPLERSYVVYHLYHMHEFGYYTSYAWVGLGICYRLYMVLRNVAVQYCDSEADSASAPLTRWIGSIECDTLESAGGYIDGTHLKV